MYVIFSGQSVTHYSDSNLDAVSLGKMTANRYGWQNATAVAKHYDFHRDSVLVRKGPWGFLGLVIAHLNSLSVEAIERRWGRKRRHGREA